mmetsp:Transcript_49094/g.56438  ORF Transcript_49094/g.56438 Transcript_49094/m.56438 type:complete len:475 (+) Transcript_49094:126-1550(+)
MEDQPPSEWTIGQVSDWLASSLNLENYVKSFADMSIDGFLLFQMNNQDLQEDLGIKVRLHRVKILEGIKRLREQEAENKVLHQDKGNVKLEPKQEVAKEEEYDDDGDEESSEDEKMDDAHVEGDLEDGDAAAIRVRSEDSPVKGEILVLKAVEGQLMNNIFIVGISGATIGRHSASNDIVISESFVSRRHCDIFFNEHEKAFYIRDVGSTTGTFLMVKNALRLEEGVMFQMGLSEFRVEKILGTGENMKAEILIFEGPNKQTVFKLDAPEYYIGRDPGNTLSVKEDSQMSSFHAKLFRKNSAFWLMDIGSTNRTWLRLSKESCRSGPAGISTNEIIKIGSTVFIVQDPPSVDILNINGSARSSNNVQMNRQSSPRRRGSLSRPNGEEENVEREHSECRVNKVAKSNDFSSTRGGLNFERVKRRGSTTLCPCCVIRSKDHFLFPCGHMFCEECAYKSTICTVCQRERFEVRKLYT